ncbi:amidase signature enzyme [Aaosphaeria arxii CBS 175.79]|uniref:Amidase signature enzyme n=1 Tax=Aaosphaeria arxii CBS 175.79 TaxID=1450172 RepID=A0A6A5Y4B7_9PLEO|nr:amidase signature enzyme [Aaosphaeria arxii CBS 175.79]KAF2019354.1 amidase signature enzyme [Aaosphaeria arxii CBS 175.79]
MSDHKMATFDIFEATIEDHKKALSSGAVTSVELVTSYLIRIGRYDNRDGLNAFTLFNPKVLDEAAASDAWRASRKPPRPLEGIPYTLKDSYKYVGLSVTNGSPALEGLQSNEDSAIAARLRAAGAVMIGKTNMPPMAAGGMQRGLYGRAESPYSKKYLTAAFSSGSSNGAATSTTTNMACFGLGSETVSSGRSPASNNALVAYTPSRGVLSCRGLWPLYVTCDVPVPYTRTVADMLELLAVIAEPDQETKGDFWRDQQHVKLPVPQNVQYQAQNQPNSLKGKRIGVPKIYIGQQDSDPHAKSVVTSDAVLKLWQTARADLEALGAEVIPTDFPLVTNYENDSKSREANNVEGAPSDWNLIERGSLIAKSWNEFLIQTNDATLKTIADVNPNLLFPKPPNYVPDTFLEVRNWIKYAELPNFATAYDNCSLKDHPGLEKALPALEDQRKRDLEDWMDAQKLDCVVFPANGDVGLADLEFELESTRHSLQNGIKYSNGNRAIRHLGVPTVSVPMGNMEEREGMPLNLTFAGKAYDDEKLLAYAYAFETKTKRRRAPTLAPKLDTDVIRLAHASATVGAHLSATVKPIPDATDPKIDITGTVAFDDGIENACVEVFLDGVKAWEKSIPRGSEVNGEGLKSPFHAILDYPTPYAPVLGWELKAMQPKPIMVLIVTRSGGGSVDTKVFWTERS